MKVQNIRFEGVARNFSIESGEVLPSPIRFGQLFYLLGQNEGIYEVNSLLEWVLRIGPRGEQGPRGDKGDTGDTGDIGPQGIQGTKGDKGDTGNSATWISGSGVPSNTLGNNNDMYIDTSTSTIYQKQNTWQQLANIKGESGKWLTGSGTPAATIGAYDDLYLDIDNSDIYKKISNWNLLLNIRGIPGTRGLDVGDMTMKQIGAIVQICDGKAFGRQNSILNFSEYPLVPTRYSKATISVSGPLTKSQVWGVLGATATRLYVFPRDSNITVINSTTDLSATGGWTAQTIPATTSGTYRYFCSNGNIHILFKGLSTTNASGFVYSINGINWLSATLPAVGSSGLEGYGNIVYFNNMFITISQVRVGTNNVLLTSMNATAWNSTNYDTFALAQRFLGVFNSNLYVCDYDGLVNGRVRIYKSNNGTAFTKIFDSNLINSATNLSSFSLDNNKAYFLFANGSVLTIDVNNVTSFYDPFLGTQYVEPLNGHKNSTLPCFIPQLNLQVFFAGGNLARPLFTEDFIHCLEKGTQNTAGGIGSLCVVWPYVFYIETINGSSNVHKIALSNTQFVVPQTSIMGNNTWYMLLN